MRSAAMGALFDKDSTGGQLAATGDGAISRNRSNKRVPERVKKLSG